MISKKTIISIQQIPLVDILAYHNVEACRRDERHAWYRCPLHDDSTPSLRVDLAPDPTILRYGNPCRGFYCFSCKISGAGSIELEAALSQQSSKTHMQEICQRLAKLHNIPIENEHGAVMNREALATPSTAKEISVSETSWTDEHLRALGCEIRTNTDADGVEYKYYSWGGADFYGRGTHTQSRNFNPSDISATFGIVPISSYDTPAVYSEKHAETVSYHFTDAGGAYPMFWFKYSHKFRWYGRKYEPFGNGDNPRFTWWWQDGRPLTDYLSHQLYGDADVMSAYDEGNVSIVGDEMHPAVKHKRPSKNDPKEMESYYLYHRIVICSGPRDAMQVYYHSDAHVVWPHSEAVDISISDLIRLRSLCENLYVCYDSDARGVESMERIALDFPDIKMIELPSDLGTLTSQRTGKPCKDVSDFFEQYSSIMRRSQSLRFMSINTKFENMLSDSDSCKFWVEQKRKAQDDYGEPVSTYEILTNRLAKFLSLLGLRKYQDETGNTQYVQLIMRNVIKTIPEKELELRVDELIRQWLSDHAIYNNERIKQAVSVARCINKRTIGNIQSINPNFVYWKEQLDMLLFSNGALVVTPDDIKLVPYDKLKGCYINYDAIHWDKRWDESNTPVMRIEPNPAIIRIEQEHKVRLSELELNNASADKIQLENDTYRQQQDVYSWKVSFLDSHGNTCDIRDAAHVAQFTYDTCRMFWREEKQAGSLPDEKQQFQLAHFVNKVGCLGYMLSQYRDKRHVQMVMATEYSVCNEKGAHGRNGKSMFADLLRCVRKSCPSVDGKNFKQSSDFAKNFSAYQLTVHGFVSVEDLHRSFEPETLYNTCRNLPIKTLYKNEYVCPLEVSPKLILTSNKPFDTLNSESTRDRLYSMMNSDYYHIGDGVRIPRVSFYTKFHYELGACSDEREQQRVYMFLAQCLQFYLRLLDVPRPPIDDDAKIRQVRAAIRDDKFCEWFSRMYANYRGVPIPIRDLQISCMRYKGVREVDSHSVDNSAHDFNAKIKTYCDYMGILINPDAAISSYADREHHRLRLTTWQYQYDTAGRILPERKRDNAIMCMIFLPIGAEIELAKSPKEDPGIYNYLNAE